MKAQAEILSNPLALAGIIIVSIFSIVFLAMVFQAVQPPQPCCDDLQECQREALSLQDDIETIESIYKQCVQDRQSLLLAIAQLNQSLEDSKQNTTKWFDKYNNLTLDYDDLKARVDAWNFTVVMNWVVIYLSNFFVILGFKFVFRFKIVIKAEEGQERDVIAILIMSGIITALIAVLLGILPLG